MAGRPVYELCKGLVGQARVTVLAPHAPGLPRRERMSGCTVHRCQYFWPSALEQLAYGSAGIPSNLRRGLLPKIQVGPFLAAFTAQALRLCRGSDIVHAHFAPTGAVGLMCKALARKPLVLTLRGTGARLMAGRPLQALLSRADAVISPHPELTRLARSWGRACVDEIPNPVDLSRFRPQSNASRTGPRGPATPAVVTFVGRLVEFKDTETFVRAVPFAMAGAPHARFQVVGDGPLLAKLRGLARLLGCADSVEFTGYRPDVLPALQRSSVFVACSQVENIWSNSLVEAMACAVPCIVTDAGLSRQALAGRDAAVLVRPGDPEQLGRAISALLRDEARRTDLGDRGRSLVLALGFSRDTAAAATLSVYDRVLGQRGMRHSGGASGIGSR